MKKRSLQEVLDGAARIAHRRAFRKKLPYAYSVDGKVFLVYPDQTRVEVKDQSIEDLIHRAS